MAKYIVVNAVKKEAKLAGKRVGKDFISRLDAHVDSLVQKACKTYNGGRKTLDLEVAAYVGAKL